MEVLRILAFALLGTFVIAARGYALLSLGRLRAMLISNAIALGVVFAAGIPLISAHGATGGAIALTAAELTLAAELRGGADAQARPRCGRAWASSPGWRAPPALAVVPAMLLDLLARWPRP